MNKRIVSSFSAQASRSMGPNVRQVIPSAIEHIDPFVFLDHFGPMEKLPGGQGVPPHPHAGIATITYLFSGSNRHQDSYGHDQVINVGDMAWMRAGKGIIHAEGMNENRSGSETIHGLQFWISLPAKDKFIEPDFFHYSSEQFPVLQMDGATIKILSGALEGRRSPVESLSPAYMFEIKIPAGQSLTLPIASGDTCGLYMVNGRLLSDENVLLPTAMTAFDVQGDQISIQAQEDSHLLVFGGTPLNEPIVGYAFYVMNSIEQIHQVINDYQSGKMGTLIIK
ncbi:MAG: pirin family protein [Flavobacteriia bacterium]|jgi:redox-sensitive bicupin YhaK (pirin superfamily)